MRYDKEHRGWRGIVLTRWFLVLMVAAVGALIENPWLAGWLLATAVAGILVAIILRFT
jgi:hypothetical protein